MYTGNISDDLKKRILLTSSCKDCNKLPRFPKAGEILIENDKKIQYMFNGIKIYFDSYHSPWMNQIIYNLKGIHEPQEELVFYYLVKLLPQDSNMLELGCAWAYYSMFFKQQCTGGTNICIEPNILKLNKGIENIKLNNFDNKWEIINGFIGKEYKTNDTFIDWDKKEMKLTQYSIESIVNKYDIFIDIIHSDIQGSELDMLIGSTKVLDKIGFYVISTHDDKHQKCIKYLNSNNFTILIEHNINESFSADGLILAVNNKYIEKYEKNIENNLKEYFISNCDISRIV